MMKPTIVTDLLKQIIDISKKGVRVSERIEQVQDQDKEDFNNLTNRVGHLEVEFKSLKEAVNKIPQQTQDQVAVAVMPVVDEAQSLKKTIDEKKILPIKEEKKKHWWSR